jgi:hypothetical protein
MQNLSGDEAGTSRTSDLSPPFEPHAITSRPQASAQCRWQEAQVPYIGPRLLSIPKASHVRRKETLWKAAHGQLFNCPITALASN